MARGRRVEAVEMLKHRQGGMGSYAQAGGMLVMLLCVEDSQPKQKALGHCPQSASSSDNSERPS